MDRNQKTFKDTLERLRDRHGTALMDKARTANRLAKHHTGRPKARIYNIKHNALITLITVFPEQVRIRPDRRMPGIIEVATRKDGSLHIPESDLWNFAESEIQFYN